MNPADLKQFSLNLNNLVNQALKDKIPVQHVIFELGQVELETREMIAAARREQQAQAMASAILPANGVRLPHNRQ